MTPVKNWTVYLHENRVNGKRYIGITGREPTLRWCNGNGYSGNQHFYSAIQKYGWDAFRHEILYTNLTREEAERIETDLIAKYGTLNPEKGYNLAPGGFAPSASNSTRAKMSRVQKALWSTEEHKNKMRAARLGHQVSEEARRKISQANMGHPVTPEARERMRANHPDVSGAKNPRAKAVICLTTGTIYPTAAEAAIACGTYKSDIAKCCKGKAKTAGGLRWGYYTEGSQIASASHIQTSRQERRKRHG